jgi:hypothetical protein
MFLFKFVSKYVVMFSRRHSQSHTSTVGAKHEFTCWKDAIMGVARGSEYANDPWEKSLKLTVKIEVFWGEIDSENRKRL